MSDAPDTPQVPVTLRQSFLNGHRSREAEGRDAAWLGGRVTAGSGAVRSRAGGSVGFDIGVHSASVAVEHKRTDREVLQVQDAWITKVEGVARRDGKTPALVLNAIDARGSLMRWVGVQHWLAKRLPADRCHGLVVPLNRVVGLKVSDLAAHVEKAGDRIPVVALDRGDRRAWFLVYGDAGRDLLLSVGVP